jgi:GT2 family glycosyltransferase
VTLIASPSNEGYPAGNNRGLRALGFERGGRDDSPRYALALNPDTVLPPVALCEMVAYLDAHPEVGVAGPKLLLLDGSLDLACRRSFPSPAISFYKMIGLSKAFPHSRRFGRYNLTYLDPDQEAEVDSVVGAFMLVRRAAIQQVGLFDETFFMYGEDLDWAYRIKAAGWKVMYYPRVTVTHVKRAASRQSRRAQNEFYRAMLIFYRKHYRRVTPWWLHSLVMAGLAIKGGRPLWRELWHPTAAASG